MNKLARLSAEERRRLIDNFADEVFSGLDTDPGLAGQLRQVPDLPEDPTPEQVDAWVELAELVSDPDFRRRNPRDGGLRLHRGGTRRAGRFG